MMNAERFDGQSKLLQELPPLRSIMHIAGGEREGHGYPGICTTMCSLLFHPPRDLPMHRAPFSLFHLDTLDSERFPGISSTGKSRVNSVQMKEASFVHPCHRDAP